MKRNEVLKPPNELLGFGNNKMGAEKESSSPWISKKAET
jgi:hypothetical protein